jgi:threonine/homoserine/homoserine lactone efflux protein
MNEAILPLLGTGFLLGWSVAWPPGPINAEVARRCLASGFWAGFGVILGACTGDGVWAVLVALGIGVLLTSPALQLAMGIVSIALLLALAVLFLRGAWRSLTAPADAAPAPGKFDSHKASYLLGAGMALTSPWNVAFWLAAVGRPEIAKAGTPALLAMAAAVIAGALTWGVLWSTAVVLLHRRAPGRWWDVGVKALTAALMLYFAATSALRLWGGG